MTKEENYKGFNIQWLEPPLTGDKWQGSVASNDRALYDRMWDGDRFVEPGQIYSHRSRLCGKLAEALPDRDARQIVITVPRHGLMLNLPKEEVVVR